MDAEENIFIDIEKVWDDTLFKDYYKSLKSREKFIFFKISTNGSKLGLEAFPPVLILIRDMTINRPDRDTIRDSFKMQYDMTDDDLDSVHVVTWGIWNRLGLMVKVILPIDEW